LTNLGLRPGEGAGGSVVAGHERIDVLPEFIRAGEAGALERLAGEDGEPALDLIEPGGSSRRVVEVNGLVPGQPPVALALVGVEVVGSDVDLASRMGRDDAVHEIEELDPAPSLPA